MVREVGHRMRKAWDEFTEEHPRVYKVARDYGTPEAELDMELRDAWRRRMMQALRGVITREGITLEEKGEYPSPLYEPLWDAWQRASKDPDDSIPRFIREGVPLGMHQKIPSSNGIFLEANDLGSTEDATPELELMKGIHDYVLVTEQPEEARIEIDRCKKNGFVRDISRRDAAYRFGCGTASELALSIETEVDLAGKKRVVIDLSESRDNEHSVVNERLVLPRISDVFRSLKEMHKLKHKLGEEYETAGSHEALETEFYRVNFTDGCSHFAVHRKELRHCLSLGLEEGQWLLWGALLFGFKSAPLLTARLSSAVGRLIQSMAKPWESMAQIYVDDLLLIISGSERGREHLLSMNLYTLGSLGMMLSLGKGERGRQVVWSGTSIELFHDEVRFGVPRKMCDEILEALSEWPSKGMISLEELRTTTGRLSWLAGIIPRLRWAVSVFYAALANGEHHLRSVVESEAASGERGLREKPHFIAVKKLGATLPWLTAMVLCCRDKTPLRKESLFEAKVVTGVVTGASPLGLGAILIQTSLNGDRAVIIEAME